MFRRIAHTVTNNGSQPELLTKFFKCIYSETSLDDYTTRLVVKSGIPEFISIKQHLFNDVVGPVAVIVKPGIFDDVVAINDKARVSGLIPGSMTIEQVSNVITQAPEVSALCVWQAK